MTDSRESGSDDESRSLRLHRLLADLKRRHVFRVAAFYGVVGYTIIEVSDTVFPRIPLPDWTVSAVVWMVLLGFPIALLLAWALESTPEGLRRAQSARPSILDAIAAQPARRRWPIGLAAVAGSVMVLIAAWGALGRPGLPAPAAGPRAAGASAEAGVGVAVLPFRTVELDTLWSEGLLDLLAFNLDGIPGLRKIDPTAVLSAWRTESEDEPRDSAATRELARELGARYVITTQALRAGSGADIRLIADVVDLARSSPAGRATVDGPADSLLMLIDRLTVEILRRELLPVDGDTPLVNVGLLTTTSLDAAKAYLHGERQYRLGRYEDAIGHYQEAVALDSTFARALYRLGGAFLWLEQSGPANEYFARAASFADRLPERDARLIGLGNFRVASEADLVRFTQVYRDDADGWMWLGESRFHGQGSGFVPMEGYREAFERAMRLAPYYEQAYYHLLEDAFARLDAERVGELLPGLRRIDPERTCPGIKLAYDLRWGADTTRNRALAGLDSLSVEATTCAFVMIAVAPELMEHTERTQLVGLPGASPVEAGAVFWRLFQARLWNGQPAAVHRLIDERMDIPKFEAANRLVMHLSGYPADSAGLASAVDVLTDTPMLPEDVPSPLAGYVLNHFWLGFHALQEGRERDAARHADAIARSADTLRVEFPGRADTVAAYGQALVELSRLGKGDLTRLTAFEAALWTIPRGLLPEPPGTLLRYHVGRLLLDRGRLDDAERYFRSLHPRATPYYVPAQYYLGQIQERRGRTGEALEHYRIFVEWWQDADRALQPRVEEAFEALRRLASDS